MHCDTFDASGIVVSVWEIFTENAIKAFYIECPCRMGEIVIHVYHDSTMVYALNKTYTFKY
jgi:hypothetical protein